MNLDETIIAPPNAPPLDAQDAAREIPLGLPPEAPLAMPVQDLARWDGAVAHRPARPARTPWLARLAVFGGALALTAYGGWQMLETVSVSGSPTVLQLVLVVLFCLTFSWIALAFTSALVGFGTLLRRGPNGADPASLATRTAILMPVYNETTARVFAGVEAMHESVAATGLGRHFDWFILSDSTQADAWIAEERAFLALRDRLGPEARLYYRHRAKNHHRKAGNIADFVTRWGGRYDHMLVLDADSLMSGSAIVTLAAAMEGDPDAGIIQTLPLIINRNTLFARLQQFAARIYGPVIAAGLAVWSGRDGNYWGHNAIIRTRAFASACGLPDLPGKPPFGGHILSHDFVEAALIRRAGWAVYMLHRLPGSYEESPPSLIDVAVRDRRWAQGNLQHARVIGAAGLHPATRQHFATGIAGYLASPLWLLQLIVGILLVLQTATERPDYFGGAGFSPVFPRFDPVRALQLFGLTMAVLLAPKILGLILALLDRTVRRACGGGGRLVLSSLVEILLSALVAPVAMVIQSGSVASILLGRDTGWNPQRRDDGSIPLRDIVARHGWHMVLGLVAGVAAFALATSLFLWMSPTILGLVLAIPISWASGQLGFGLALKQRGLLATPEEAAPPEIALRAGRLTAHNAARGFDGTDALTALHDDPDLAEAHARMLPVARSRPRGAIDPDQTLATAKICEAETVADAQAWLSAKERSALLQDRALVDRLVRLGA
jgi:membrane glycosyltransferase